MAHREVGRHPSRADAGAADAALPKLRLSAADKYLLSRCDGKRDVRALAQMAPLVVEAAAGISSALGHEAKEAVAV